METLVKNNVNVQTLKCNMKLEDVWLCTILVNRRHAVKRNSNIYIYVTTHISKQNVFTE